MPTPSSSLATLRPDLGGSVSEISLAEDRLGFIGLSVLRVKSTAQKSGEFGIIPIEQLLTEAANARAPGAGYGRDDFEFEPGSYNTKEYGHECPVDDNTRAMYADYFDAEKICAERARDKVLRRVEMLAAAAVFNAVTWTPTAVSTEWSTVATATPITDVRAAKLRMWNNRGIWPNALIINAVVLENLRSCEQIIKEVRGAQSALPQAITLDKLKEAFGLKYILVSGSAKNTAATPSLSVAPVWSSEYAAVAKIAESDDIEEPCVGRTFHWTGDGSTVGGTMETYRDETKRSDIVRCRMQVDPKIIYSGALELLSNITA